MPGWPFACQVWDYMVKGSTLKEIFCSQQNIPVEFLRIYYRGDRYTLYSELYD
jgi:hypothetical protein